MCARAGNLVAFVQLELPTSIDPGRFCGATALIRLNTLPRPISDSDESCD
jgi:hypothetical protein